MANMSTGGEFQIILLQMISFHFIPVRSIPRLDFFLSVRVCVSNIVIQIRNNHSLHLFWLAFVFLNALREFAWQSFSVAIVSGAFMLGCGLLFAYNIIAISLNYYTNKQQHHHHHQYHHHHDQHHDHDYH